MKKSILKGAILGLSLLSGITASAQFTLDGQYRPRLEVRNGFKTPIPEKTDPAAFVEHRARLTAGYKQDKLGFKLSVQDVRIWGEVGQINKTDQGLSVHEAYGDYYASKVSTFRIGRQELNYDGDRFVGSLNWAAQARAFDAVRYMYKNDSSAFEFDLALTFNQDGFVSGTAPEPAKLNSTIYTTGKAVNNATVFQLPLPKAQQLAYVKYKFGAGDVGLMLLNEIRETWTTDASGKTVLVGTPYNQFHIGLTPNFKFGDYKLGVQGYYSGGTLSKSADATTGEISETKLGGYMASLTFQGTKLPAKPLIGFDYISGDDQTTDKVEGWAPLYGTNHKFYGFMDYFFVGNGHGGGNNASAGLLDIYLKTTIKTGEKSKILAHLHNFSSTATRQAVDANGELKDYKGGLGTEIDIVYVQKLAPGVVFKAGYSHMLGISETMNVLKGYAPEAEMKGVQNWGWAMINFTPKFLNK